MVGFLLSFFFWPKKEIQYQEKVQIKEVAKVEYKDKIVEKVVYQQVAKKHEVVKTITKYIERPDGTKEKTVEEVSETKEEQQTNSEAQKQTETEVKKEVVTEVKVEKEYKETLAVKNWHVGASVGITPLLTPVYGGQVERRIVGPFFLGLRADTNPSASLVIGMEF